MSKSNRAILALMAQKKLSDSCQPEIERDLEALGIEASSAAVALLVAYSTELVRWSRRVDLTAARSPAEFANGPLFDALCLMLVLDEAKALADIGSGGGLPGLPAAILVPSLRATLIEPRAKRAAFLRHAVHLLGLDAKVLEQRDESLPDGGFQSAVAQAVWPPAEWSRRGARLVSEGGAVYVLTATPLDRNALDPALEIELERGTTRPSDGALRFAFRLKKR